MNIMRLPSSLIPNPARRLATSALTGTTPPTLSDVTWTADFSACDSVKAVRPVNGGRVAALLWKDGDAATNDKSASLVMMSDADGATVWGPNDYGLAHGEGTEMTVSLDSSALVVVGQGHTKTTHDPCCTPAVAGKLNGRITKVSVANGAQIWTHSYDAGGTSFIKNECWGIAATNDGGYAISCGTGIEDCRGMSGTMLSDCNADLPLRVDERPGAYGRPKSIWQSLVVRTDGDGNLLWQRVLQYRDDAAAALGEAGWLAQSSASEMVFKCQDGALGFANDEADGIGLMKLGFPPTAAPTTASIRPPPPSPRPPPPYYLAFANFTQPEISTEDLLSLLDFSAATAATSDAPCFAAETTTACKLVSDVTAAEARRQCYDEAYDEAKRADAELVLMKTLVAGDVVLAADAVGVVSLDRVIVNQHKANPLASLLLEVHHAEGMLSLTPYHVLLVDGAFVPAREAKPGSTLTLTDGKAAVVERVTETHGAVINPVTTSGTVVADGVVATTHPEWTWPFRPLPLFYAASATFPATAQAYYDAVLEPLFDACGAQIKPAAIGASALVIPSILADATAAFGLALFAGLAPLGLVLVFGATLLSCVPQGSGRNVAVAPRRKGLARRHDR